MHKLKLKKTQKGFTIIELMISTAIFSLVLMLCIAGILQITKMYYKGVNQARTQEAARLVVEEIGESIRFSNDAVSLPMTPIAGPNIDVGITDTDVICIGSKRYTFAIDRQLKDNPAGGTKEKRHVLWVDQPDVANCSLNPANLDDATGNPSAGTGATDGVELLSENMRLTKFSVERFGSTDLYRIDVEVMYGDEDLMEFIDTDNDSIDDTKVCRAAFAGAEFCAKSSISLIVGKRL